MDNKRKIALAVIAVAVLGFGSFAWNSSSEQPPVSKAEHGTEDGHERTAVAPAKDGGMKVTVRKATAKMPMRKRAR